jgi:1-acyl-sn-glycerol-3-phosphate acyltransferase
MGRILSRGWRIAGTGLSFALFGAGGLVLGLLVFPFLRLLPGSAAERQLRAQLVVHHSFRLFVGVMQTLRVLRVTVRGEERLRQAGGQLVVANHPTLLDVVMLGALLPQLDCVVKRGAWANPFMRWVVTATGYLPNDLGDALVDACAGRLLQGRALLLFPEGTRSPKGALGPFQRGAAHTALRSGRPLLPVFIGCEPLSLTGRERWYQVPERRMHFTIEAGELMDPTLLAERGEPRGAAARRVTAALRGFYEKRLR